MKTTYTTRADMAQAVLEDVTFALRDSVEIARSLGVKIDRVRATGGGAIVAAVGCGAFASMEEAGDKLIRVIDVTEPDAELVAKYDKKYQVFKALYPALKTVFDDVATN